MKIGALHLRQASIPERTSGPQTLPAALIRSAQLFGDLPAFREGRGSEASFLIWRQLSRRVEEAAAGLVTLGLRRGDRVALCAENSIDWITALYASSAAGASAVLVYFDLKPAEIVVQVERPGCRFLFASQRVLDRLGASPPGIEHTVILSGHAEPRSKNLTLEEVIVAGRSVAPDGIAVGSPEPDDLAAIVYTSGTTAGPKGVMLSHRNLVASATAAIQALKIKQSDSALLVLPLHHSFAFTVAAVLPALAGGQIIFENDLRRIPERLKEYRPTIFFGVPALFELMYRGVLARADSENRGRQMLAWQRRVRLLKRLTGLNLGPLVFRSVHQALGGRIRLLVSGAAALKPQTALDYYSLGLPLVQGAGVTESADGFAVQRFSRWRFLLTRHYERRVGSIGQALPGIEARLIDVPEKGIEVATSHEGELLLRGPSVFMGYWQAPEATEAALWDGWLRTGDLARIDEDGEIYLTGRAKYVIVLDSGEKVHPDELEAKLEGSEFIKDVCILGRPERGKIVVTAIVYPDVGASLAAIGLSGRDADAAEVESLIAAEVSDLLKSSAAYKHVGRIELVDVPLPKTAVGKIARGRLADSYSFDFEAWRSSSGRPRPRARPASQEGPL